MGFFDGLLGNASKVDAAKMQEQYDQLLLPDEEVHQAYQLIRDSFLFTNHRLILIDRQGVTGSKIEYHSLPYKNIIHFSVETAGTLDLDAELKIWLSGNPTPIEKQFNKKLNVYDVQRVLAHYVLQ